MKASSRYIGIGSVALATAVVGLATLSVTSQAQDPGPEPRVRQGEPLRVPPQQGNAPMPRDRMAPMQMGMGGGAITMIDDAENLYILRGNTLFKVAKGDLAIKAQSQLPMGPPPMRMPEGEPPRFDRGNPGR